MGRARLLISTDLVESILKNGTRKQPIKANPIPQDATLVNIIVTKGILHLIFESPSFTSASVVTLPPIEVE